MFIQTVASGLYLAAIYGVAAFGLVITFGVLNVLNLAHGSMIVLGALLAISLSTALGAPILGALLAVGLSALAGVFLYWLLFSRVEGDPSRALVLSIGLISVLSTVELQVWGPESHALGRLVEGSVSIASARVPTDRLVIIGMAVVALVAAEVVIARTRIGRLLRATAQNPDAAELHGINVSQVRRVAFAVAAVFASVAGILVATTTPISGSTGESLVIKALIVIILGGIGSTKGALAGATVLGMAEAFGLAYAGVAVAQLLPLGVLVLVLLIRPQGIFGFSAVRA